MNRPAIDPPADHQRLAETLVSEMHANDGLAPVDLERFWADDAVAHRDAFGAHCPQVPLGMGSNMHECVFAELDIPEQWERWAHDLPWRMELNKAYNDKAQRIVGRRLLDESLADPRRCWPAHKQLHDIFEAQNVWHEGSYWLQQSADSPNQLEALLDRVEGRLENLRDFVLPEQWDQHKPQLQAEGVPAPRYRGQRGPVTFATSVYGVENLLFLIIDQPELAERFRDLILRAMLGLAEVLDVEAGDTPENVPRGFTFLDDNCCLLSPETYELFGYPVLKGVFERYSPKPGDRRYQHSDSPMAHLLPLLGQLKLTGVNFGPTVLVKDIRPHLPGAVIDGVIAPFTFSRNEETRLVLEFLRDFEQARETRGLVCMTAGSINNGSRLTGLRLIMAAIQRHGRYDA